MLKSPTVKTVNNGPSNNRSSEAHRCVVCDIETTGLENYRQHIAGSRHATNLKNFEESGVVAQSRKRKPQSAAVAGQPKKHLAQLVKETTEAVVGLEYVTEIVIRGTPADPTYECELCNCKTLYGNIIYHIIGYRHRHAFIEKHRPQTNKRISDLVKLEIAESGKAPYTAPDGVTLTDEQIKEGEHRANRSKLNAKLKEIIEEIAAEFPFKQPKVKYINAPKVPVPNPPKFQATATQNSTPARGRGVGRGVGRGAGRGGIGDGGRGGGRGTGRGAGRGGSYDGGWSGGRSVNRGGYGGSYQQDRNTSSSYGNSQFSSGSDRAQPYNYGLKMSPYGGGMAAPMPMVTAPLLPMYGGGFAAQGSGQLYGGASHEYDEPPKKMKQSIKEGIDSYLMETLKGDSLVSDAFILREFQRRFGNKHDKPEPREIDAGPYAEMLQDRMQRRGSYDTPPKAKAVKSMELMAGTADPPSNHYNRMGSGATPSVSTGSYYDTTTTSDVASSWQSQKTDPPPMGSGSYADSGNMGGYGATSWR